MTIIYTCNLVVREVYRTHLANRTCIEDIRNLLQLVMSESQTFHIICKGTEIGRNLFNLVVVQIERRESYLRTKRMYLLDIIVSQVEQTEIYHLSQCRRLRELLQVVVAHIENLECLTGLLISQTGPVASQLVGRDTLASCQVHRLQFREIIVEVWNTTDLRTVVEFDIGQVFHLVPRLLGIFLGKAMVL